MVSPLAGGAEETWSRILAGRSGANRIENFEVSDLPCQIACQVKRGDGANGTFNPDAWMEPKEQRKVDDFIIYAVSAATQALADAGWAPEDRGRAEFNRRSYRIRHRRTRRHLRGLARPEGEGAAAPVAVLRSRPPHQPGVGPCLDHAPVEGAQSFGRHGLLHRRACDRRRGPPDRVGRCGRDGRRRRRIGGQSSRHGGLRRLPRAVDRLQRPPRTGPRVPTTRIATAS